MSNRDFLCWPEWANGPEAGEKLEVFGDHLDAAERWALVFDYIPGSGFYLFVRALDGKQDTKKFFLFPVVRWSVTEEDMDAEDVE